MSSHRILYDLFKAPFAQIDPDDGGTITINRDMAFVPIVTVGASETRILAQPTKAGLRCTICHKTDGGDFELTVTGGYNAAAETTLTFAEAGDMVDFVSVDVGGSFYWYAVSPLGVPEWTGGMDIHSITAASAVPDVADLIAGSDESATGDPTLAFTVTEVLSAAGDLTDLAAAPATDDRLLVTDESAAGDPAKSMSVANLFTTYFEDMTEGTGISTATGEICEHRVTRVGGLYKTEILLDLTGLNGGGTANDIIGKDGETANCHIGQITAAKNGTIIAGRVTCFEAPTGCDPDVDLCTSTAATGAQDADSTALAGYAKLINHGDWSAEEVDHLDALPAADSYIYLACGTATDADYTAGILLIELWGK